MFGRTTNALVALFCLVNSTCLADICPHQKLTSETAERDFTEGLSIAPTDLRGRFVATGMSTIRSHPIYRCTGLPGSHEKKLWQIEFDENDGRISSTMNLDGFASPVESVSVGDESTTIPYRSSWGAQFTLVCKLHRNYPDTLVCRSTEQESLTGQPVPATILEFRRL